MRRFFERLLKINIDTFVYSLSFFCLSIYAARFLSLNDVGVYAILYSFFLLGQGVFNSVIGEMMLAAGGWKNFEPGELKSFALVSSVLVFITFSLFCTTPLVSLGFQSHELAIYFLSCGSLVLLNSGRYCLHLENRHLTAAVASISSFATLIILLVLHALELLPVLAADLHPAIALFSVMGFSSCFVNMGIYGLIRPKLNLSIWSRLARKHRKFLKKSSMLSVLHWCTGNLHWILLGWSFGPAILGVLRGCLALINPLQVIDRGMTISILSGHQRTVSIARDVLRHLLISMTIYTAFIIVWFANDILIVEATIGKKYLEYRSVIDILIFIPLLQSISSLISAGLKSQKILKPQISTQVVVGVITAPLVMTAATLSNVNFIALSVLGVYFLAVVILVVAITRSDAARYLVKKAITHAK